MVVGNMLVHNVGQPFNVLPDSANTSQKALTIAIRYGAIRRQFASEGNTMETKLLDYPIHQHRLMPLLALSFAIRFTGLELNKLYENLMEKIEVTDNKSSDFQEVINSLKETHATSAGLKAFCTWFCLNTIEQCRQACGGHGYSSYVGLAGMYQDFAVQCTWEVSERVVSLKAMWLILTKQTKGDNTILALQSGRYLVGCYQESKEGKHLPPGVGYLNNISQTLSKRCKATSLEEISDLKMISEAWGVVSADCVQKAGEQFLNLLKKGESTEAAYEKCCKWFYTTPSTLLTLDQPRHV
jgi:acyl-CoA oxidase